MGWMWNTCKSGYILIQCRSTGVIGTGHKPTSAYMQKFKWVARHSNLNRLPRCSPFWPNTKMNPKPYMKCGLQSFGKGLTDWVVLKI